MGRLRPSGGLSWASFGPVLGRIGLSWTCHGDCFGLPWVVLWCQEFQGSFLDCFGLVLGCLGPVLGCLGPVLHVLGLPWAVLGLSWGVLGLSWGLLWGVLGCLEVSDAPRVALGLFWACFWLS